MVLNKWVFVFLERMSTKMLNDTIQELELNFKLLHYIQGSLFCYKRSSGRYQEMTS